MIRSIPDSRTTGPAGGDEGRAAWLRRSTSAQVRILLAAVAIVVYEVGSTRG